MNKKSKNQKISEFDKTLMFRFKLNPNVFEYSHICR